MQINQFHSGTAVGDAITNQMLLIKDILVKNGYKSNIYAEYIDANLSNEIKSIDSYRGDVDGILIVHHSMATNCFETIKALPDKKILIYHNITPEKFFQDRGLINAIRLGLKQTEAYKDIVQYYIADTNYNRQELIKMGYPDTIDVMPVSISLNRFDHVVADKDVVGEKAPVNILFVGRVVPNKRQDDVITAFSVYNKYFNPDSRLYIVGNDDMKDYVDGLKRLTEKLDVDGSVVFTGKVSEEALKAYYEIADVFLCMSEHEGFGVPLLEAMKMGVPVVAYRSSAIAETMDHAGVVVTEKNYAYIGALLNEIMQDRDLYARLVERQKRRIEKMDTFSTEEILLNAVAKLQNKDRKKTIQLQGPFETSYSLAIVNRKLMETMDDLALADISIYCTEGPGDYEPKKEDLESVPHATALWKKSKDVKYPDVTIRNMYPPRVNDVNGGLNFQLFGWEESVIPSEYITNFNHFLSGIGTMSDYVTEKLIECGLKIPVATMGIGVELAPNFESLAPFPLETKKRTKFLHISSAFPRKGVDILLKAYFEAFSGSDDVCLILKTFPNPHNNVEQILQELKESHVNPPQVEWINRDLSSEELSSLYKAADCYVQVARGEGFGLPVAEAMLAELPVIVSPNTGMADFCNEKTAFLIGYDLEPANTHLSRHENRPSMWCEPRKDELVDMLKKFYEGIDAELIAQKVEAARQLIQTEYSWESVAKRWGNFISDVESNSYKPKVAMVTTWNNKCGIAEFTKMEVETSDHYVEYQIYPNYGVNLLHKDEEIVQKRLWHSAFQGDLNALTGAVLDSPNDIVHFQFNFGFFELKDLAAAIEKIAKDKKVIITFHKTADAKVGEKTVSLRTIVEALNKCAALVVHQDADVAFLKEIGVKEALIRKVFLGQIMYPEINAEYLKEKLGIKASVVVGSYGFLLPHKGIKEGIQATAILKQTIPDILYMPVCSLHEAEDSRQYYLECVQEVERLDLKDNVRFITDYLDNDESMKYLQACDIMVMPYKPSKESASGAVRFCAAAVRPIITTEQDIFREFADCTYQIKACEPELIASAVDALLDKDIRVEYSSKLKKHIQLSAWDKVAKAYHEIYLSALQ